MQHCRESPDQSTRACPRCGRSGREVGRITLKALLQPRALARSWPGEYRFCPAPECPIVYFGEGEPFRRHDLLVPVFQKEAEGARIVCYCVGVSEDQIRREVEASGASASADRIGALVRSGRCACEVRNPRGTCCLGDVVAVIRSVRPEPRGALPVNA
jgi:bacterioferritin-associated ferredoxin